MSKDSMISSQLIERNISDERIVDAFSAVDREDFVLLQNKRTAYSDIELPIGKNKVSVRPFVLAKILEKIVDEQYENVLIVGDATGYTSMIFHNLFRDVTIGTFESASIEWLRLKIDSIKVNLIDDLKDKFDLIFLDSGFYKNETIKGIMKLLSLEGDLIYFSKKPSFEFTPQQFDFFDVSVMCENDSGSEVILEMPLYFSDDLIG